MHKVALTAALASLVTLAPAQAEETHDWSGLYGGVYVGMAKASADWTGEDTDVVAPNDDIDSTVSASGTDFGGFVGMNWQNENLVLGLEASYGIADASESDRLDGAEGLDLTTDTENLGSVRARLGFAMGEGLVYLTGGLAFAKSTQTWDDDGSVVDYNPIDVETNSGWVAGAGVEFALTETISVRAEGLYYDLGSGSDAVTEPPESDSFEVDQTITSARIGVAYHF